MNNILKIIFFSLLFNSCIQDKNTTQNQGSSYNDSTVTEIKREVIHESTLNINLEGEELFAAIKDTISIQPLNTDVLVQSVWIYNPYENCFSQIKFTYTGKGKYYDCEIPDEYEIIYRIESDTLHIERYDTPRVDNPEMKKIKSRDDYYIYTGKSLVMIGSQMYNLAGKTWIPGIKTIIEYQQKDVFEYESELDLKYEFLDYQQFELNQLIVDDFNGDHKLDTAEFVTINNKGSVSITNGKSGEKIIIGGGNSYDDGRDDFSWVDNWGITHDKETYEVIIIDSEIIGTEKYLLKNPSIILRKEEAGGGIITYKNGSYRWVHQSD